ncbi:type VII secretion protein EccE [Gordonia zhaorongruii]|uniref:type VII secretion protein EccE n=1 Tax=Gordonia zhaorongruii TaxID=2597659 RepID=UPI00104709A9|nr:type VII secretion protein EccE [Gordonia zhaorongruii]
MRTTTRRRAHARGRRPAAPSEQRFEPFDVPDGSGGYVGVIRDGPRLVCVLAVEPPPPEPVFVATARRSGGLPLDAVAACLMRSDARPDVVEIVERTLTSWGDGPAARAYRDVLGPLAPASHRSVALVIRIDPARCPDAVALRGGGPAGALRTTLWCLRRLTATLRAAGARTRPFTAAALSADAAWTWSADRPVVALVTASGIDGAAPPQAGDGQLIGAAQDGEPVALRMAGPQIGRVDVAGDVRLARQVVVRLAALGVRCHVLTDRTDQWRPLVHALSDGLLLSEGPTTPPSAQVVVHDRSDPPGLRSPTIEPGLTSLVVHRDRPPETLPGYLLQQDAAEPALLHVIAPGNAPRVALRTVTTQSEKALTG